MKKIFNFSLILGGIFVLFFSYSPSASAQLAPVCKVKENGVYFQPSGTVTGFTDDNKPLVKIVVETENCSGKKLELSIVEDDYGVGNDDAVEGFDNLELPIPSSEILELTVKAGEDECEVLPNLDCNFFYIDIAGSDIVDYSSTGKPNGELKYECDSFCDEYFEFYDIGFGDIELKWFFFGSSLTDVRGGQDTKAACETERLAFPNPTGPNCFSKITATATPPPPTTIQPSSGTGDSERNYELLAPIPGLVPNNIVTSDFKIGTYVNNLIKIVIGLAAVLAVVMIVFGGIQWMMSDSFLSKGAGKEIIKDALLGLLLALGAFLILKTINPDLVNLNLGLSKQTISIAEIADDGSTIQINYSNQAGACPTDCVNLLPEVPIKNSSGKQIEKEVKKRLTQLSQSLASDSLIAGRWGTTEAWQPSRNHKAACHPKGTCIDANFNGMNPTPAAVKSFVNKANAAGLCAIYEVSSSQSLNEMLQGGVPSKNIKNYGTWISAPHFSVYGGSC